MFQQNAKQDAPAVLEQVLIENKTLNDKQKQAVVDKLKKNGAVQRMVDGAGRPSPPMPSRRTRSRPTTRLSASTTAPRNSGPDHLPEVVDRPEVHDQPGKATQEIWGSTMQKYGPQVGKAMRDAAEKEIAAAAK